MTTSTDSAKVRPWVRKLLVVRSADDAAPWAKHASKFVAAHNYQAKSHGTDQTRLLNGTMYAPMMRTDDDLAEWQTRATAAIKNGAQYLLGIKCVSFGSAVLTRLASRTSATSPAPTHPRLIAAPSRPCSARIRTSRASCVRPAGRSLT